ncbi:MAG: winged helix-turn-helix domain-containing protein [Anaerolineales bacterium]|nr:winged helix-turn-helix domain-containing protein [Anaerolineales bacterium]
MPEDKVLAFEHVRIDTGGRRVWVDEDEIESTATEFDLLLALAEKPGGVLSREQVLEKVWGCDYFGEIRVVDVYIGHIRQKLGDEDLIGTMPSVGYRFRDGGGIS